MLKEDQVPVVEFGDQKVPNEARLILLAQMNAGVIPKDQNVARNLADSLAKDGYTPQKVASYVNIMVEEEQRRGGGMLQAWMSPESTLSQAWLQRSEEHAADVMNPEDRLRTQSSLSNVTMLAQLVDEFPQLGDLFKTMSGQITSRTEALELAAEEKTSEMSNGQALVNGAWIDVPQEAVAKQQTVAELTQEAAQERTDQLRQQAQLSEEELAAAPEKESILKVLMADIGRNFEESAKKLGLGPKDEEATPAKESPKLSEIDLSGVDLKTFRQSVGYEPIASTESIERGAVPISEQKIRQNGMGGVV
jgi:hypothetical protein